MGSSDSIVSDYEFANNFNNFLQLAIDTNTVSTEDFKPIIDKLGSQSEKFFETYTRQTEAKRAGFGNEGINISSYFTKISKAVKYFNKCLTFLRTLRPGEEKTTVTAFFSNDLSRFIKQVIELASFSTNLLQDMKSNPLLMTHFYFELSIFDFSLTVGSSDKPPYYSMSLIPCYNLKDKIHETNSNYITIIAPHCSGKTTLVPLHVASRLLIRSKSPKFIILIEQQTSSILDIKTFYRQICENSQVKEEEEEDKKEEEENQYDLDDNVIITSSLNHIIDMSKEKQFYPIISILSPIDALHLIHSVDDLSDFVSNSVFIFDDIHMRNVETDVLIQDIFNAKNKNKNEIHSIFMSPISLDKPILNFIGHHHEELKINNENEDDIIMKDIYCDSISEIRGKKLFKEMNEFFKSWANESSAIQLGSVIIYVPSEKVGQRFYKELFDFYSKDNSTNICPIDLSIRPTEKVDDFYNRLYGKVIIDEKERPEGVKTLFLLPINATGIISLEEKKLLKSQLPLPFMNKLSRVFITTIKNESLIEVNDLKVVFDTGLVEVEYFDTARSVTKVREELLPLQFLNEHSSMLGKSGKGIFYKFNLKDVERPENFPQSSKNSDLSRQILLLRSLGIKLEEQNKLPTQPNHEIINACIEFLQKIGLIDSTDKKELTEIGKEAAKFAFVSPFFALATAKFTENQPFALLCSLLIENSRKLILNPQSKLLCKHFNRESDVVTLLEAVCEISERIPAEDENIGLSIGTIFAIYSMIENAFKVENGRETVINAVKWAREQPGGTLGMVDKFVLLLPQEEFIKKRKASFKYVVGAGPGSEPTLIYKAKEIFKIKDEEPTFKFAKRPGWIGLQCPGKIITLSLILEEENNRGIILHRNNSAKKINPGIISFEVNNPSLNSFFFVSLFEAYWGNDKDMFNDFVGIYHSPTPSKESAFLIHMTDNDNKTFLNYCPLTKNSDDIMRSAIPLLSSLMPFVARSIIAKVDIPISAVEINGYGTSQNYSTFVHLINEPETNLPFAYPVNKVTLQYAKDNLDKLPLTRPPIRFAITGESFYYRTIDGVEKEAELTYPNTAPLLTSVFHPNCSSHLVLLVEKDYPNKPPVPPLSWLPKDGEGAAPIIDKKLDIEQNKIVIDVTDRIMTGFGYAERSADIFFISLGKSYPKAGEMIEGGEVPENIRGKIGFSPDEDGAFKLGIYPLVRYFIKEFTKKQELVEPIPIVKLDSTKSWPNYPTDEGQRDNLLETINRNLMNHFHLEKIEDVQSYFIGTSMIAIRFDGLPQELVTHEIDENIYDTYTPCKADNEIMNVLRNIGTIDLQVSSIIHQPTINICVQHMRRFAISSEEFIEKVTNIAKRFGFLRMTTQEYSLGADDLEQEQRGVIGKTDVELIGFASGIAFSTIITQEFDTKIEDSSMLTSTVANISAISTIYPDLGPAPTIGFGKRPVKLSPGEIEVIKEKIAKMGTSNRKNKWTINSDFNVLIVPASENAKLKEMMKQVRDKDNDTTCLYICEPPQKFLPQSLYAYQKDGSVRAIAICQPCMIESFRNNEELQDVIDPITKIINRKNLASLSQNLNSFAFLEDGSEVDGAYWPQIPFAQGVFALMSGPDEIQNYVIAWFTAIIDFVIRKAANYFTFCPNHPDIPYRTPTAGKIKCPYCDMIFCDVCKIWHNLSDVCKGDDEVDGMKRCPNCHVLTFKYDGCNHITCPCGKHWCYKCGSKSPIFSTGNECYAHLNAAHGGYYT